MNRNPVNWLAAFLIALVMGASTAVSADASQGQKLATDWCSACHFVNGTGQASDTVPSFGQMASPSAYPDARLRGWLHAPHPPMPDLTLSRYDIDNIIAYIRTLGR